MDPTTAADAYRALVEAHSLGLLEGEERLGFEQHLGGCAGCQEAVSASASALARLTHSVAAPPPDGLLRQQTLDLADSPPLPIDPSAYDWLEVAPGIRIHLVKEDPVRKMRGCLVWAGPGVSHARHRHGGDEVILVLQGRLRDDRGDYGPGEICRSRTGSVHAEEVLPGDECFCYVLYYGDLEYV
jgi:putative transcriptional regulator